MDRGALQITVHEITKRDKTEQKSQHISDRRLISKLRNSYNSNKLNLEKAEEPEIKLPTFAESEKKQGNSRKASTSVSLSMQKPLTVWITTNCGNFLEMGISDHLNCLLRNLCADQEATVKNQTWNNGRVPNWERSILSPCLFNFYTEYIM